MRRGGRYRVEDVKDVLELEVMEDWLNQLTVGEDDTLTASPPSRGQWHMQRTGGLHLSGAPRATS